MPAPFAALILAAGKGTRMRSARPKVLHELAGKPLIAHVLGAVAALKPQHTAVVIGPNQNDVAAAIAPADFVIQRQAKGTGSAVAAAKSLLGRYPGDILIVAGDAPLVTRETFKPLFDARRRHADAAVIVLGMRLAEGGPYGRLILADDGSLARIVEAADCTEEERAVDFVSSGVMLAKAPVLFDLVAKLGAHNAQGEQYLTDVIGLARAQGLVCRTAEGDPAELLGVNSRDELAYAEAVMQQRLRWLAMENGVSFTAPETVFLCADTKIGRDTVVGPFVVFGPGVKVGEGVAIPAFCHIEGATIGDHARIGPFARLRPGALLGDEVHIGNFVEVKNSRLAAGVKANHLAYLGDSTVGEDSNIGAGAITCNFDGLEKFRTNIGKGVFVGTNASLVAPLSIGPGAMIAAGSVITDAVPADALAIGRARQRSTPGAAKAWRAKRRAEIAARDANPAAKRRR
jgi:bifunctional UDP-N-acetylglucosamine pyrophosphorylase/glucosamine-1-phosphate N-acetyltransferase